MPACAISTSRSLLGDLGAEQIADDTRRLVPALDTDGHHLVVGRSHTVELERRHELENVGALPRYQEATVQAARKMEKAGIKPFKGDAHAFLVWAYQNPELDFGSRLEAAKAAAPFEKPRLSSTQVSAPTIKRDIAELTREELLAIASGSFQYQNIDAPVKETRDEWLARQMGTTAGTPASSNSGDVMH